MKRTVPMFIALAFSAASMTALAAEERPGAASPGSGQESSMSESGSATAMPSFEQADQDGSGSVEISEATGIAGLDMSAADTDSDGKLSRSEYEAAQKSHEQGSQDLKEPAPTGVTR